MAHGGKVGEKLGGFGQQSGVDVEDGGFFCFGEAGGFSQEESTGDIFPLGVGIGKVGSDIARTEGSKNRIGQSVKKNIGIGVTLEPPFVGNGHAAKDEGSSGDERMNIIAKANAQHELRMSWERV